MIAVVGNKEDWTEQVSDLVDNCRLVVRVNKMELYKTWLTGKRVDWVFQVNNAHYWMQPEKNLEALWCADRILLRTIQFRENWEALNLGPKLELVPEPFFSGLYGWTTTTVAIRTCMAQFPGEQVLLVGEDRGQDWLTRRMNRIYEFEWRKQAVKEGTLLWP